MAVGEDAMTPTPAEDETVAQATSTKVLRTPEQHTLVHSTLAKDGVFKAQGAAALIRDDGVRRRVERDLSAARTHLESTDRALRDAMERRACPPKRPEATITYRGSVVNLATYVKLRMREADTRCDCGAPEQGHAPDCSWVRSADDFSDDFSVEWAGEGERS